MELFGIELSDVALAGLVGAILGAVVGGLFQFGSTLLGKRIVPPSEHLRNLAQKKAAEAAVLSEDVETSRDIVKTYREEVIRLRREVSELRPLRDEVLELRRELHAARQDIQRFRNWIVQHEWPEPPPAVQGGA